MMSSTLKKSTLSLTAAMMAVSLSGCSDASAKLSDSSTALFSVGSDNVTKGEVYEMMITMSGASTAIGNATNIIALEEIEITDEIREQAEETLETYTTMYGDSFTSYLESADMTEDEYLEEYLIPSLLSAELTTKYIEMKWDDLVDLYNPVKATVLLFTSQEDSDSALEALNAGTDPETVATDYSSSTDGTSAIYTSEDSDLDSLTRATLTAMTSADGWVSSISSDGSTYALMRVDEDDPENYRDDLIETLEAIENVETDATTYFFRKYGFHIYDITLYNAISADYPDNLVQDMTDDEPDYEADEETYNAAHSDEEETAESTAEATAEATSESE